MSIFSILKSDTFASTLQTFSGKAKEVADSVTRNMPSSMQGAASKAKEMAGSIGGSTAGKVLGVGALTALVGSIMPRSVVKTAALVGVGAIAMNFYQKWSAQKAADASGAQQPQALENAALPAPSDPAAMLMLRAMVYAARADGHIDESEKDRIGKLTAQFMPGQDTTALVQSLVSEPIQLELLAGQMQSQEQREDLYRLSCLVLDIDHFMERGYLDALAGALAIDKARQEALETEAHEAKTQLDAM